MNIQRPRDPEIQRSKAGMCISSRRQRKTPDFSGVFLVLGFVTGSGHAGGEVGADRDVIDQTGGEDDGDGFHDEPPDCV